MSEIHFRSNFWSFQIDTQLFFLEILIFVKYFYILDVQKSLSVAFLAISDQYETFFEFFYKMAGVGHFECPKFTLDHISGHFRSIQIFYLFLNFLQNGCRRPFWMSENHFRSNFWPFQINTKLFFKFLTKWPRAPILDVRNSLSVEFLAISDRYATFFFWKLKFL